MLLILALLSCTALVHAQNKGARVYGKIIDSATGHALEYATVTLYLPGNPQPKTGAATDASGRFDVSDIPQGTYNIVFEFIGFAPKTREQIVISEKAALDLGTIRLARRASSMQAVVVTAQAKVIENKIDKMVFNAEKDITSQTGVAADVLKKVPMVSVDVDGNVELAGSSSVRFLINGKPSTAFGNSVADVLQSIPASQIKSIEVITNPGAKYDAQGLGGIINIILKQNTARGTNGSLALTGGTRASNGSFNFNARRDNFGMNAFVSGNLRPRIGVPYAYERHSYDNSSNTTLQQSANSAFQRQSYQTGLGFDWTLDEQNSITGSASFNHYHSGGHGHTDQTLRTEDLSGNLLNQTLSYNEETSRFNYNGVDASLGYKKTFRREDQELQVNANTSIGTNAGAGGNRQYLLPTDSLYYGTSNNNPAHDREGEIQADYTQPLKKNVTLGTGAKASFRDINSTSDVLRYQTGTKQFVPDTYLSNSLRYRQQVYAAYAELSFPAGTWFDAKLGARYERTGINAYYSNAQHQQIPGYGTFVPSVFLSKKFGDDNTIKLNYSRRIERPDFRDLNPFINTSDVNNFSAGNPYLKPEVGQRYELDYNRDFGKAGSVTAGVMYRTSDDDIQSYVVYYPALTVGDSTYTNVSVSTRQNIGRERDWGFIFFGDLHPGSKLSLRGYFFLFRRHTLNAIDHGYDAHSVNFRTNLNASYQFSGTLAAEFFGNFSSARNEVQGKYPSFINYSFALRKQFWNKNGSLALTAVNPFAKYVDQKTILSGPNFDVINERKIPFRSFGINFTWKFGKLEFKKKDENNMNISAPE